MPIAIDPRHESLAVGQQHQGVVGQGKISSKPSMVFVSSVCVSRVRPRVSEIRSITRSLPAASISAIASGLGRALTLWEMFDEVGRLVVGDRQVAVELQQGVADLDLVPVVQRHGRLVRDRLAVEERGVSAAGLQPITILVERIRWRACG